MENKRGYYYKIGTERIDFTRRATIKSMFDCVLDAAGLDAEANGFGAHHMAVDLHATWVLIRMGMNIYSLPQENETVCVRTWVSEITPISSTRNFEVENQAGEVVAAAVSLWTVINIDMRKMMPINKVLDYTGLVQPELGVPVPMPLRIKSPEVAEEQHRKVCYSDVDFNRHAHSTNYLQWAFDMLPVDELIAPRPVRVDVNYLRETKLGDSVKIVSNGSAVPHIFEISSEGETSCRIAVDWK